MPTNESVPGPRNVVVSLEPLPLETNSGRHDSRAALRRLSAREAAVIEQSVLGTPLKLIAAQLNVSDFAVASYLSRAKRKLSVRSRTALQKAIIGNPTPLEVRAALSVLLTAAEVIVAESMLSGSSNAEIATQRGTSVRTVENQIARLFHKLGIRSRFELLPRAINMVQRKHL